MAVTNPTLNAPTPAAGDNTTRVATTAFVTTAVSNAIAGVNPAVAVEAASAAILPNSPTYNNGVGGIGATITAGVTNTTLVVDGYTPILLDRILVKNEAGGGGLGAAKNGVYYVSQLAALGLAWILTRALDYNQPSDMNDTGAIPVINGTVNIDTSWVLTSRVTTVGTDALTFTQFSLNPTTIVTTSRQIISGAGLTGGGDLSADRTLAIGAGTGITVNADDVAVTPHALLDGSIDNDTVAQSVSRGSLIYGNSTPKWDELVIGTANKVLFSDGTDASWSGSPTLSGALTVTGIIIGNATAGNLINFNANSGPAIHITDAGSVNGETFISFRVGTSTVIGTITGNGVNTTAYNTTSDARLKRDLGLASDVSGLLKTRVHDFEWLQTGEKARGVFAQEAYGITPNVVSPGSDERDTNGDLLKPWMADYSKFVPDLIVGFQQLEARLRALEAKR